MLKKIYLFVDSDGKRVLAPELCGDQEEHNAAGNLLECDITWGQVDALFQDCNTYTEFIRASIAVQAHYRNAYQNGTFCPKVVRHVRLGEVMPEADRYVYIIQNRDKHGKRAILNRLKILMKYNQYREKEIDYLEGLFECNSQTADEFMKTPKSLQLRQDNALCKEIIEILCKDSEFFDADGMDFYDLSILNGCKVLPLDYKGRTVQALYDEHGRHLATCQGEEVVAGLPYFVNQRAGYLEDDFYGTVYIPQNKAITSFFVLSYSF